MITVVKKEREREEEEGESMGSHGDFRRLRPGKVDTKAEVSAGSKFSILPIWLELCMHHGCGIYLGTQSKRCAPALEFRSNLAIKDDH